MLYDLYVYDKAKKVIHRIGDKPYDSIWVSDNGIRYQNLKTSEYGDYKESAYERYVIVYTNAGRLVDYDGDVVDKRFEFAIKSYMRAMP